MAQIIKIESHKDGENDSTNNGGYIRIPNVLIASLVGVVLAIISAIATQVWQNATTSETLKSIKSSVSKLEQSNEVQIMTRYTAGEAARDFGLIRAEMQETKSDIYDHEKRLRRVEKRK